VGGVDVAAHFGKLAGTGVAFGSTFPSHWLPPQMLLGWTLLSGMTWYGIANDQMDATKPMFNLQQRDNVLPNKAEDGAATDWVLSSPPFDASQYSKVSCATMGGTGSNADPSQSGFLGIAVTTATTAASAYVSSARRSSSGGDQAWVEIPLSSLSGTHYLHVIDKHSGSWGWFGVTYCNFQA